VLFTASAILGLAFPGEGHVRIQSVHQGESSAAMETLAAILGQSASDTGGGGPAQLIGNNTIAHVWLMEELDKQVRAAETGGAAIGAAFRGNGD
jgi:hypothetical protein